MDVQAFLDLYVSKSSNTSKSSNKYMVRVNNDPTKNYSTGKLEVRYGKPPAADVPKYIGKVGTVKRTRKGRTRRNANGWIKYDPRYDITEEVILY